MGGVQKRDSSLQLHNSGKGLAYLKDYAPHIIGVDEADANARRCSHCLLQNRMNQTLIIARGALSYVLSKQHFKGNLLYSPNK